MHLFRLLDRFHSGYSTDKLYTVSELTNCRLMGFVNKQSTCCINVCAYRTNERRRKQSYCSLLKRRFVVMRFGQFQLREQPLN